MAKWWIETRPASISSLCISAFVCLLGGTICLSAGLPWTILGAVALLAGIGSLVCIHLSFRELHKTMTRLERQLAEIPPEALYRST